MTKRCRHEYESKTDYPNEIFCMKCSTGWYLTECIDWNDKQLMTLPKYIRLKVLKNRTEIFNMDYK